MPDFIVTCPAPQCGKPLRWKSESIGQPTSCPYCSTSMTIELGADGSPTFPQALGSKYRVPRAILIPGFLLLLLGIASAVANGYIAFDAMGRPGASVEYARKQMEALQNTKNLAIPANETKKKRDASGEAAPQDQFALIAGQAARVGFEQEESDRAAVAWAGNIVPLHLGCLAVCVVMVLGAMCTIAGRFYWLAIAGSLISVLNVNNMCCIPCGIVGVWCFLQLIRDEGRMHFGLLPKK
jgi:endogenous inhibitor of DNA gyrase (YacG/DUF329 family)